MAVSAVTLSASRQYTFGVTAPVEEVGPWPVTLNESEVVDPAAGEVKEATPLPKVHVMVPDVLAALSMAFTRRMFAPVGFQDTVDFPEEAATVFQASLLS